MMQFNPTTQILYCRDIDRVHFGKAPRIGVIAATYGRKAAELWLEIQLNDLSEFAGCKGKLTVRQIKDTAAMIVESYPHYNLTEFMLFFQRFKRCEYGRFYGSVDPMIILQALSEFAMQRRRAYTEYERRARATRDANDSRAAEELRQRYAKRVPDAFTSDAPLSFLQYQLTGCDSLADDDLRQVISDIRNGRKNVPKDARDILQCYNRNRI